MMIDLEKKLIFSEVVYTYLRPDIMIWPQYPRRIILVELTVPWDDRTEEAYEHLSKYQDRTVDCHRMGWLMTVFPVEIRCRGFPAQSLWRMIRAVWI